MYHRLFMKRIFFLDLSADCILSRYMAYEILYNSLFLKAQSLTGMSKNNSSKPVFRGNQMEITK